VPVIKIAWRLRRAGGKHEFRDFYRAIEVEHLRLDWSDFSRGIGREFKAKKPY
jgi:hypothetical protein